MRPLTLWSTPSDDMVMPDLWNGVIAPSSSSLVFALALRELTHCIITLSRHVGDVESGIRLRSRSAI